MEFDDMFEDFLQSTDELIDKYLKVLFEYKEKSFDGTYVNELFRIVHSMKGMAATMEYNKMERVIHKLEDVLYALRENTLIVNEEIVEVLSDGYLTLKEIFGIIKEDGNDLGFEAAKADEIINKINLYLPNKEDENSGESFRIRSVQREKLEGIISEGNLAVFEIEIANNSDFKCVRAFVALRTIDENMEIAESVPSRDILENCSYSGNYIAVFVYRNAKSQKLIKVIQEEEDVKSVCVSRMKQEVFFLE